MTCLVGAVMTTRLEQLKRQFDRSVLEKDQIRQGKLRSRGNTERIMDLLLSEEQNIVNKVSRVRLKRRLITYWHCGKPMIKVIAERPRHTNCSGQHPSRVMKTDLGFCAYTDCNHHVDLYDCSDLVR